MFTIEFCKRILNNENINYNNEEIKAIRDYLYLLAEIEIDNNILEFEL